MKFTIIIIIVAVFSIIDFSVCYQLDSIPLNNTLLIPAECLERIINELSLCQEENLNNWIGEEAHKSLCCREWDDLACARRVN